MIAGYNDPTPIYKMHYTDGKNVFYIKRDDLFPFSFGGNKARKAALYSEDILRKGCNYIVTYGSKSSNHLRVIANMSAVMNIPCAVIIPVGGECTANSKIISMFDVQTTLCSIDEVRRVIDMTMNTLQEQGYLPYFIQGGGHGNIGTQAYVHAFQEIVEYERINQVHFDYIFHASGTGTTQAGLVCGCILHGSNHKVVGISIARSNPYGTDVIVDSVNSYLESHGFSPTETFNRIELVDEYLCGGYGSYNNEILSTILEIMKQDGIPLDATYTGKAFYGMKQYIKKSKVEGCNILFIHTDGTPLFFDILTELNNIGG